MDADLRVARVAGMPLETRGALAWLDGPTNTLTVISATQVPLKVRTAIARVLEMDEERVRIRRAGRRRGLRREGARDWKEVLVAAVARRLGRPVKWIETRREHMMALARDQRHHARLALTADGRPSARRRRSRAITAPIPRPATP